MFIVFRGRYGFVSGFSARLDFVEGERAGSEGGEESAGVMGDEAEGGPTGEGRGTDGGNSLFN